MAVALSSIVRSTHLTALLALAVLQGSVTGLQVRSVTKRVGFVITVHDITPRGWEGGPTVTPQEQWTEVTCTSMRVIVRSHSLTQTVASRAMLRFRRKGRTAIP